VTLRDETYLKLQRIALGQGKTMADLATEIIAQALSEMPEPEVSTEAVIESVALGSGFDSAHPTSIEG
jgi:predicted DNA-binding protein